MKSNGRTKLYTQKYQVLMTLAGGSTRYAMSRGRIASMFMRHAGVYYDFVGAYGFGSTKEQGMVFGEIHYLHNIGCVKIRPITKVELIPI